MELTFRHIGLSKRLMQLTSWMVYPLLLSACTTQPTLESPAMAMADPVEQRDTQPQPVVPDLPISDELLFYVLTAEIAGQRGEIGTAIDLYGRAAEIVDSRAIASRSTQIATLSRDQSLIQKSLKRWQQVAPDDADVYMMEVPLLLMSDRYTDAVKTLDKAIRLAPENTEGYLGNFAAHLSEMGNPSLALELLSELTVFQAGDPTAWLVFARLATFYRGYEQAEPLLDKLLQLDAENEEHLILKAEVLQRTGRGQAAFQLVETAAQRPEASHELRFTFGKLLGESGESERAQALFEEMHAEDPENGDVLFALGLLALERNEPAHARELFFALMKLGDEGRQAAFYLGIAEEMRGDYEAALMWYRTVAPNTDRFESAQTRYIRLLAEQDRLVEARQHLASLRAQFPQMAVQFFLFEASFLRELGLMQEAFDLFSTALILHPLNFDLLYGRAMVAEGLNRLDMLEADLRQILEQDPNNSQALNALGYTLTDRTNRHQEALALITKALEIKPNDPFYLDSLGWVYYRLGDLQLAEQYLREAIAIQPDAEFLVHLGEVLWMQGNRDAARQLWGQARAIDAENPILQETVERLEP